MKNKHGSVSTGVGIKARVICKCHPENKSGSPARRSKNLIRIFESFVMLPAIALSIPAGGLVAMKSDINSYPQIVLAQQDMDAVGLPIFDKQAAQDKTHMFEARAEAIDAYFAARGMPMKGTGMKMVLEADKNGIDWRLLPAIAVRESTGGKNACKKVKFSRFGFGGCKFGFESSDNEIEVVARNLGGNNPNTAKHYDGKTTKEILQKYNPPSVVANYYSQVLAIMNAIGSEPIADNG